MKAFQLVLAGLLMATSAFGIVGKEGALATQLVQNQQVTLSERLMDNDALATMETPAKPSFAQKMAAKIMSKKLAKKLDKKLETVVGSGGSGDTAALLSLIFGATGFIFMFLGPLGFLGLLLGIAGLITGIIALKRTENRRVMAILGTIFGAIVTLLALLIVVVIGLLISAG